MSQFIKRKKKYNFLYIDIYYVYTTNTLNQINILDVKIL